MKRFIDLRQQGTHYRFTWFDTVVDKFESFDGAMCWDTFEEFADCYREEHKHDSKLIVQKELNRYAKLTPAWVFEPPTGDEEDRFWAVDPEPELAYNI